MYISFPYQPRSSQNEVQETTRAEHKPQKTPRNIHWTTFRQGTCFQNLNSLYNVAQLDISTHCHSDRDPQNNTSDSIPSCELLYKKT